MSHESFDKCSRCKEYSWAPCRCEVVGRAWLPDHENEASAETVWSRLDMDDALAPWTADRHARDYELFMHDEERRVVAARLPCGKLKAFSVTMEMQPVYRVELADDDEAEEIGVVFAD